MRIKAFVILPLPDVSLFLLSCDLVLSCNADHSPSDLQRLFMLGERQRLDLFLWSEIAGTHSLLENERDRNL